MPFGSALASVTDAAPVHDVQPDAPFDEAATVAAALCRTEGAVVILQEEDGSWYGVSGSLATDEFTACPPLCHFLAAQDSILVFPDTHTDARLAAVPLLAVSSLPPFAAAAPIHRDSGEVAGLIIVSDRLPRTLTAEQQQGLTLLSRQVARYLDLLDYQHAFGELHLQQTSARHPVSEELFRTFMNASPFLSYLKDAAGRLLFYNRSYAHHFGIGENSWLGRTDEQLWNRSSSAVRVLDADVLSGGGVVTSEEQLGSPDGTITHWKTYRFPCVDSLGNLLLAGLAMDISRDTERKQELEQFHAEMRLANEQLRRLSVTDELTGLRNRRAFEERLAVEFSVARRRSRDLAVLLLDVDNFKSINDRWGHATGDVVLRKLSSVLRTTLRLPDLAARYGGEEFIVLLPESGIEAGEGFCRRLMARLAAESWDNEPVTVSIGLATLDDTICNSFQLISRADESLYTAKRQGKNRLVVYGQHAHETSSALDALSSRA